MPPVAPVVGLIKGPWKAAEDAIILKCLAMGLTKWNDIASRIAGRVGKQCRERYFNHLDPNISKKDWTAAEDMMIEMQQKRLGNRWCEIARYLDGRSENGVKNRWNSAMRRKMHGLKAATQAVVAAGGLGPLPAVSTDGEPLLTGLAAGQAARRIAARSKASSIWIVCLSDRDEFRLMRSMTSAGVFQVWDSLV